MGVKFGAFPSEPFAESKLTHTLCKIHSHTLTLISNHSHTHSLSSLTLTLTSHIYIYTLPGTQFTLTFPNQNDPTSLLCSML